MEAWMKNPDREGLEDLVAAIVHRAAEDWRDAMKILKKHPDSISANRQLVECEDFFRSQHFNALTGMDGEYILKRLKEDFDNGG